MNARGRVDLYVTFKEVKHSHQCEVKRKENLGVLISELARLTGVSPRSLRHYEEQGLLTPARDANGYRHYTDADVTVVARIRIMIAAGLGTTLIRQYLDCAGDREPGMAVKMCPSLRTELDGVAARLARQQAELAATQRRLVELMTQKDEDFAAGAS